MPDYLSSMSWRMSGDVFGQPPARPYLQLQYARKQYPTRTGGHSIAIGEHDSGAPHNWGAPALPWRRVRCCCGTSRATDEHHSRSKLAYLARKSKKYCSRRIFCLLEFHCLLSALCFLNIHCVQLGIEGRERMRKFRMILYNEVRTNLSLKKDALSPRDAQSACSP